MFLHFCHIFILVVLFFLFVVYLDPCPNRLFYERRNDFHPVLHRHSKGCRFHYSFSTSSVSFGQRVLSEGLGLPLQSPVTRPEYDNVIYATSQGKVTMNIAEFYVKLPK